MKRSKYRLTKKVAILVSIILFSSIITSYVLSLPSPGHGGDQILISTNNGYLNFQQSLSQGLLNGTISLNNLGSQISNVIGHKANEIWVKVNGTERTLQDAINNGSLCCSSCAGDSTYSTSLSYGHYANQILISNLSGQEKTLQKSIDDKDFCNKITTGSTTFQSLPQDTFCVEGDQYISQCFGSYNYISAYFLTTSWMPSESSVGFLVFNTSTIPSNAVITSSSLQLFKSSGDIGSLLLSLGKTNNPYLLDSIWGQYAGYIEGGLSQSEIPLYTKTIYMSTWQANSQKIISIDSPNTINKDGLTYVFMQPNSPEGNPWVDVIIDIYSSEESDINKRPKLIVNYTLS